MLTTEVVKEGEIFTVVVHKAVYKVYGEEESRTIHVATDFRGRLSLDQIETSILRAAKINVNIHEAIDIMNDGFPDLPATVILFDILEVTLAEQPI